MAMFKKITVAFLLLFSSLVQAGPYTDDLSKCLVSSTTSDDRKALVRWMFASAAQNPAVGSIATVSAADLDKANSATGTLFTKLLTESCKDMAKKAITYEGPAAMQISFQVLGQVAAGELFASPEVQKAMSGLQQYMDSKKIEALVKEQPEQKSP